MYDWPTGWKKKDTVWDSGTPGKSTYYGRYDTQGRATEVHLPEVATHPDHKIHFRFLGD